MAKKLAKTHDEEEKKLKLALNNEREDNVLEDEPLGLNALDEEKKQEEEEDETKSEELAKLLDEEKKDENNTGRPIPTPKAKRNPKKDIDPLEGDDLGVKEHDFLLKRKVEAEDLEAHMEINEEQFLGSNAETVDDFLEIFKRGASSKTQPKIDTSFNIENNEELQRELAAKQLLRNFHSRDSTEKYNTNLILDELEIEEELMEEIEENSEAYQDEALVQKIRDLLD